MSLKIAKIAAAHAQTEAVAGTELVFAIMDMNFTMASALKYAIKNVSTENAWRISAFVQQITSCQLKILPACQYAHLRTAMIALTVTV